MDKIFCLLSAVLYFCAPMHYSFEYCLVLFISVVFNAYYIFSKDRKIEIIGFNSIFSVSIILVTYIYPLFVYLVFPNYSLFGYSYNERVITKATAQVNLAYSFYALGYMMILRKDINRNIVKYKNKFEFPLLLPKTRISFLRNLIVVMFIIIIITGGLAYFRNQYTGENNTAMNGVFGLVWVLFQTLCILLACVCLNTRDKKSFYLLGGIMASLMAVGSRTLSLCIILIFFYAICLRKKYSLKRIFFFGILAFVVFSIVGRFRSGIEQNMSDITANDIGVWNYFEDFIVCSRNQYVIFDYVQRNGTTLGVSSLGNILSVIPFAQSLVCSLFGLTEADLRSEVLTTKLASAESGLGTHIVGDAYLAFGLIGVVFLFFILGNIVAKSRHYMFLKNHKGTIIYLVLLSGALFMCRGSFFYSLKNIVWSLVLIFIFGIVKKRKV